MKSVNLISQLKKNLKKKKQVFLQKKTKIIIEILNALWEENLILGYCSFSLDFVKVYLKFNTYGKSLIQKVNLLSTSGRRVYLSVFEIRKLVNNKKNLFIFFSTSLGILSHTSAIKNNVGGVILFSIIL